MTNYSWTNGVSGDWGTAADWTGGVPNSSSADASIAAAGTYTVSVAGAESFSVASLTLNDAGATLAIAGKLSTNTGLTLTAGTISGAGTLTVSGGTIQAAAGTTLSIANLAIAGNVTLGSSLTDTGGLSVNSGTFALGSNALTVGTFAQLGNSVIDGTGTLTVSGAASFGYENDTETGSGTTLLQGTTAANGFDYTLLTLDGGHVLENAGTLTLTGGTSYQFISLGSNPHGASIGGGTIQNDSGAIFDIQANGNIVQSNTGTTAFTNAGTLKRSAGTGTASINSPFTNTGAVSAQSGTLAFNGGFTDTGAVSVGTGDAIVFNGGGSSSSSASFSVATGGTLGFAGGTFAVTNSTFSGAGAVSLTAGTLTFGSSNATITGSFAQSGGVLDGTGTLTMSGAVSFGGSGDTETGSGTTLLKGTTAANGSFYTLVTLDGGHVLENAGTLTLMGSTGYQFISLGSNPHGASIGGGTIQNDSGAIFDIQTNGNIVQSNTGTTAFTNAGTLKRSAGTGTASINTTFTNTGAVSIATGTLALDAGGSIGGSLAISGTLTLGGGTFSLTASSLSGKGTLAIGNATVNLGVNIDFGGVLTLSVNSSLSFGAYSLTVGSFNLSGSAKISGTGTLTVTATATLGGGGSSSYDVGAGTTDLKGSTTLLANFALDGGRLLKNEGVLAFQAGPFYLGHNPSGTSVGGATMNNAAAGVFDFQADGLYIMNGSGTNSFANSGMVKKSAGTGTSYIQVAVTNTGTISAQSGTLELDGPSVSNQGTMMATGGGVLGIQPGSFTNLAGTTLTGGTYEADAGSKIQLANNVRVVTDAASIVLSGANSVIQSLNTGANAQVTIDSTLTTIAAGGYLSLRNGRNFTAAGAFTDNGALSLGGVSFTAGSLAVGLHGTVIGKGIVAAPISNAGVIRAAYGALTLQQAVTGAGSLEIDTGATLVLGGTVAAGGNVFFTGANATLAISQVGSFADKIVGLAAGDRFDLLKTAATGARLKDPSQLVISNHNGTVMTIELSGGNNVNLDYSVASDGKGGTYVLVTADQPPVTTAPATKQVNAGVLSTIGGMSVADADAVSAGETLKVVLSDATGLLSATASGGTVAGSGTNSLTLTGSLSQVNAELATVGYKSVGSGTADTIDVLTSDGRGGSDDHKIAVTITPSGSLDPAVLRMAQAMASFAPGPGLGQVALGQQMLDMQPRLAVSHHF